MNFRLALAGFLFAVLPASADNLEPSAIPSEASTGDFMTAAELAAGCGKIGVKSLTPYQQHEATVALGYIWGVIAGADSRNSGKEALFCPPPVDAYQACETMNAWLTERPDMLDKSAARALLSSFRHAYPCTK